MNTPTWAHPRQGFTYRQPNGELGWRLDDSQENAESSMAFAHKRHLTGHCNGIEVPKDVAAAYAAGWTVVRVGMTMFHTPTSPRSTPAYARGGA